MSSRIQNTWKY